jgi:hypothetical protein
LVNDGTQRCQHPRHLGLRIQLALDALAPGASHPMPELFVPGQSEEAVTQPTLVLRRHKEPRDPIRDDVGNSPDRTGDDRATGCHGLDGSQRGHVSPRREHENIALRVQIAQPSIVRTEILMNTNMVRQIDRDVPRDDVQLCYSRQIIAEDVDKNVSSFAGEIAPDEQQSQPAGARPRRLVRPELEVDTDVDDVDPLRLDSAISDESVFRPL